MHVAAKPRRAMTDPPLVCRCGITQQRKDFLLNRQFACVTKLESVPGKNLDPVIGPWVMRGRNHYARGQIARAGQVSHSRCRDHAGAVDLHAHCSQSLGHAVGDPPARFSRILPDDGLGSRSSAHQVMPKGTPDQIGGLLRQRKLPRHTADPVGTEELPGLLAHRNGIVELRMIPDSRCGRLECLNELWSFRLSARSRLRVWSRSAPPAPAGPRHIRWW